VFGATPGSAAGWSDTGGFGLASASCVGAGAWHDPQSQSAPVTLPSCAAAMTAEV